MEPTYEYIKGKGWVLQSNTVVTMQCGTVVRIVPRNPNPGERWQSASIAMHPSYLTTDWQINTALFGENISKMKWQYLEGRNDPCDNERFVYVTIEKIE